MITIYTDGSSRGNPGPGGWGAIIIYNNEISNSKNQTSSIIKKLSFQLSPLADPPNHTLISSPVPIVKGSIAFNDRL